MVLLTRPIQKKVCYRYSEPEGVFCFNIVLDRKCKISYNRSACSEGKSFDRNDEPDKARTEMSVLIRLLLYGKLLVSYTAKCSWEILSIRQKRLKGG